MKSFQRRLENITKHLAMENDRRMKQLVITIRDEKYEAMFNSEYLNKNFAGYKSYLLICLPDNGRNGTIGKRPYTINEY